MILDLHRQGLSVSAIAKATGADRKTVRKYIARGLEPPAYGPRKPRRDCQDFRVRAAIMDLKEVPDGTTQSSPHS